MAHLTRRDFLRLASGWAAAQVWPNQIWPGQTTAAEEAAVYFVPAVNYWELPADCYDADRIRPREIILHSDGNQQGRALWVAAITYETLKLAGLSSHFAVDHKRALQLLPMQRTTVQQSRGAKGYNTIAINIEMAGTDFDTPGSAPPPATVERTLHLVSWLMDFYAISFAQVVGHFERDPRGLKHDPGPQFMAAFRTQLLAYRQSLSPLRRWLLVAET